MWLVCDVVCDVVCFVCLVLCCCCLLCVLACLNAFVIQLCVWGGKLFVAQCVGYCMFFFLLGGMLGCVFYTSGFVCLVFELLCDFIIIFCVCVAVLLCVCVRLCVSSYTQVVVPLGCDVLCVVVCMPLCFDVGLLVCVCACVVYKCACVRCLRCIA